MSDKRLTPADREALQKLLETWLERREAGEEVNPAELCRHRPELLEEFSLIVRADAGGTEALAGIPGQAAPGISKLYPKIPDFDVIASLGSGGRGHVYLARQASLSRFVGLKVLRAEVAGSPTARRRFLREAEIAASLEHRNIVPVYAVGETKDHAYIAMKWLSGPALDEVEVPMPPAEVAKIGADVARALHEAHDAGIVHRDIKPANIMLDRGEPCVLDFGLARITDDCTITSEGEVSGTLPYMSPEQLRSGSTTTLVDGRTDVYSLGATLYELAMGRAPFMDEEPGALIRKILLTEPPPMRGVDRDLQTIVLRALEKDRERRFPSAKEMAADLDRYLEGLPIVSRPIGPVQRTWKLVRRHRRAAGLLAASFAIVAITVGILLWRDYRDGMSLVADCERIEREIDRKNFLLAARLHEALVERAPKDARVADAAIRLRANERLEELLDLVQQRRTALEVEHVRSVVREIVALGGPRGSSAREREWRLARVIAMVLIADEEEARRALRAVAPGRASAALLAVLDDRPDPWTLPPAEGDVVMEHFFTAIAMRAGDCSIDEQWEEIRAATEKNRTHYRAKLQKYAWLARNGSDARSVFEGLSGLDREGHYSRFVLRTMLHQATVLNDRGEMRSLLDEFETRFPRDAWRVLDATIAIEAKRRLGERQIADKWLDWAVAKWPRDWHLRMSLVRRAAEARDFPTAFREISLARDVASSARERDKTDVAWLMCREYESMSGGVELDRATLAKLFREAEALAKKTTSPVVRADALLIQSHIMKALGRTSAASDLLTQALDGSPSPAALLEAAIATRERAFACATRDPQDPVGCRREAREGRDYLRRLFHPKGGDRSATPQQRTHALYFDACLAYMMGDYEGCLTSARTALDDADVLAEDARDYLRGIVKESRRQTASQ